MDAEEDAPGTPSGASSTAAAVAAAAAKDASPAATPAPSSGGGVFWPFAAIIVVTAMVAAGGIAQIVLRTQVTRYINPTLEYDGTLTAALLKEYWNEALILLCGMLSWWWLHDKYTPLTDAERRVRRSPTKNRPAAKATSSSSSR